MSLNLIEALLPATRQLLVRSRMLAQRADVPSAGELLATWYDENRQLPVVDQVMLMMQHAQILHWNNQDQDALDLFDGAITPKSYALESDAAVVVDDNRNVLGQSLWLHDSGYEFYRLYDQRRLAGLELFDTSAVLEADEAVQEDKHHSALPIFWRQVLRTYSIRCWRTQAWGEANMARESLQLGWPHEAAYHAVLADDKDIANRIADSLVARRNEELVAQTVRKLIACANPQRHATIACRLLARIGDILPDNQIGTVLDWVLPRCAVDVNSWGSSALVTNAWDVVRAIGPRLSPAQARQSVRVAFETPIWKSVVTQREHLIEAVNSCVTVLEKESLADVAENSLPLAMNLKSDMDYREAVDLLCHIAWRGDTELKERVGKALYPPNTPVSGILLKVPSVFGKKIEDRDKVNGWAIKAASEIRLQVQRVSDGAEPKTVPYSFGTFNKKSGNGQLIVSVRGGETQLEILAEHRHLLDEHSLDTLLESVLYSIQDTDNLLTNRAGLVQILGGFSDVVSESQADSIYDLLGPIALGEIIESSVTMSSAEAKNPLNPFKAETGTPEQLRGVSLLTLSEIEKQRPGIYGERLYSLVQHGMGDANPAVRRLSFVAATRPSALPHADFLDVVLLGLRDPEATVARSVFNALAKRENTEFTPGQVRVLLYSIRMARHSPDALLRAAAARLLKQFEGHFSKASLAEVRELHAAFATDASDRVRRATLQDSGN